MSKRASEIWKTLSNKERAYWDQEADKEKQRYIIEKESYTGPVSYCVCYIATIVIHL